MATISEAGGTIFPPVPAFYFRPTSLEDIVDHSVGRALDQFGIHTDVFPRWDDDLRRAVMQHEMQHETPESQEAPEVPTGHA
jgi:4-hydroxy-3-polyprenylbenzoate decarboxylase